MDGTHPQIRTDYRVIPLSQGLFTIVDAQDYDELAEYRWFVHRRSETYYAYRSEAGKTISMHRQILSVPAGLMCDHKNHDGLDNRRCNLRICTASQNQQNRLPRNAGSSHYKGVHWDCYHRKWRAEIQHNGRRIHIGYYDYQADAAIAYDDVAIELFGEFACLNYHHRPEIELWLQQTYLFKPASTNSPHQVRNDRKRKSLFRNGTGHLHSKERVPRTAIFFHYSPITGFNSDNSPLVSAKAEP